MFWFYTSFIDRALVPIDELMALHMIVVTPVLMLRGPFY